MNAKELRIGNLVYKSLKSGNGRKIECKTNMHDLLRIEEDRIFNYEPIEITEEWLLKFGFENVHTDWFYKDIVKTNSYQFCFNICLSNGKITLDSGFDENSIIKLKYVHQLQNLYFALTGAELTVA